MTDYGVVLFHTTSAALRGEKVLKSAGVVVKLIPVPRELSQQLWYLAALSLARR